MRLPHIAAIIITDCRVSVGPVPYIVLRRDPFIRECPRELIDGRRAHSGRVRMQVKPGMTMASLGRPSRLRRSGKASGPAEHRRLATPARHSGSNFMATPLMQ